MPEEELIQKSIDFSGSGSVKILMYLQSMLLVNLEALARPLALSMWLRQLPVSRRKCGLSRHSEGLEPTRFSKVKESE